MAENEKDYDALNTEELESLLRGALSGAERERLVQLLTLRYRLHYQSLSIRYDLIEGFFDACEPLSIFQGQTISGAGWAADKLRGSPIAAVEIRIEGADDAFIKCKLGAVRPDVAAVMKRPDYRRSGWYFSHNVGRLSPGLHTLRAYAFDVLGVTSQLANLFTITVKP